MNIDQPVGHVIRQTMTDFYAFGIYWIKTLPGIQLLQGLPFCMVALLMVLYLGRDTETSSRYERIERQVVQALNWDDFDSAKVLLQRQLLLRPDDRNARYQMARVLYETGQTDDAVLIMRQLA
ncbi:MAG: hypothetical protein EA381_07735, partial [Planctomycetaceae bacterium]